MTRIDRYLLFLYLRVLLICFASVSGLLIVVHIFSNLDEFVRYSERESNTLFAVLVEYYGPYSLSVFERLSGMMALLALLFTIAWLNKTREFTALLAAGITKRRVIRPLLLASAGVILAAVAIREFAIPLYQDRLDRNPQDLTGETLRMVQPTFDSRAVVLIKGKNLLPLHAQIISPELRLQGGPMLRACGSMIAARRGWFRPGQDGVPAGYLLEEVLHPKTIDQIPSVYHEHDGRPLLLTSADTDWVAPGSCYFVSDIDYELLRGGNTWKHYVSTPELIVHLREQTTQGGNDLKVMIHQRVTRAAVDWTLLLLGLPVLLARPDRNVFSVAGACLVIVTLFTGAVMAFSAIGSSTQTLAPMLAVWVPLLIFLPWGWAKMQAAMET